ncbi:MAG TPA: alpha-L-arabinofuranosidase C-terminal domain-containing protein [Blastocatellia bacterium]|nr:alpha-L-arabinofuranosidase C-terminal domain-containing protein [Blastocatellia bacterium]
MKTPGIQSILLLAPVALICAVCLAPPRAQFAQTQSDALTVQVDRPGAAISPTLFGLFFEDINFGADGGLYPERVKNRSFEFPDPMMGWKRLARGEAKGALQIYDAGSRNGRPNAHYLQIKADTGGGFGVTNEGFRGMGVEQGKEYLFSVLARKVGDTSAALRVEVEDADGKRLGEAVISLDDPKKSFVGSIPPWKTYTAVIRPTATSVKASLNLLTDGPGKVDVDLISLYPKETWKNRPNGLRSDLVQLLSDLKPGFLRFPGGCIVEGRHLETRYQWKTTVGDLRDRRLIVNRWNTEFRHRPTPDYYQSFGLGFYEYFLLSEDIGAEPLPILNCGMACQFNSAELAPLDDLDHYIQDALDLIEFANGSAATVWGRKRAAMGHPAPFNLKMIGVGNEQWGPQYVERYERFAKAIKAKYPKIKLITSAGPFAGDERFRYLWGEMRRLKADIVDEHYYMAPKWFRDNVGRYDDYPRTGPKVFAGEYAAQSSGRGGLPENRNDWECAMSEAAFMTGLERNADVVLMSSYAPLFAHVDAWQWTPNLIWFDSLRSYGTPNYYAQKLFSVHRGSRILPAQINGSAKNGQQNLFVSASIDDRSGEAVLKIVNAEASSRELRINLAGAARVGPAGKAFILAGPDLKSENSLDEPTRVAPVERQVAVSSSEFTFTLAPNSLSVLRIPVK